MADIRLNHDARQGQAVVEFALVLPILLMLLMATVEFGRAYWELHLLTNAAREGARVGSLPGKLESDVEAKVNDFLDGAGLNPAECQVSVSVTDSNGVPREGGLADAEQGDRVAVSVRHDFTVLGGRIIPGFQGTVPLQATCVFRHE